MCTPNASHGSWTRLTLARHLKPGGYVEISEFHFDSFCDDTSCDGPYALRDFLRFLRQGMKALGSDLHAITSAHTELEAAGFQSLTPRSFKCPIGPWPKKRKLLECGHILRDVFMWGLIGLSKRPFRDGLGWTEIQIQMFLIDVRKSLSEEINGIPKYHSYLPFYTIWGRKPLD